MKDRRRRPLLALLVSPEVSHSAAALLQDDARGESLPDPTLSKCGYQAASIPVNDRGPHRNHLARCKDWPAPNNAARLLPGAGATRQFRASARARQSIADYARAPFSGASSRDPASHT